MKRIRTALAGLLVGFSVEAVASDRDAASAERRAAPRQPTEERNEESTSSNRSRTVRVDTHRGHHGHSLHFRGQLGGGWWWNPWWFGPTWGYTTAYSGYGQRYGALDLDLAPERAEVWVDGRRIGVADDFDGFPTHLWLERGTYDVVFYLPGFRTLARQYSIYPGLVIDVEDQLEPGEATHPDDLVATSHERRDERLRRDHEIEEELSRDDRRERRPLDRDSDDAYDARREPGQLRLEVVPDDASVYLDGRFVATGRELERLRSGLIVEAGPHVVDVVRPGYLPARRQVEIAVGEETEAEIELERAAASE